MNNRAKQHPGGRPVKLTETAIGAIIEGIRQGLTFKAACKGAGLSYSTFASWMYRGRVSKKNGLENEFTTLLGRIDAVTHALWLRRRDKFFFNLKPRDFRYGWTNPMSSETKKKLSDAWKRIREQNRLAKERYSGC
jgi:hypothetical protein